MSSSQQSTESLNPSATLCKAGAAADALGNAPVGSITQSCLPVNCPPSLSARDDEGKVDIDWKFISDREGGQILKGYVPDAKDSQSGVTIATGIDLGVRNTDDINKLNISSTLKEKLKPYAGKKKKDAQDYLKEHPLELDEPGATELDKAVKEPITDTLIRDYNQAVEEANKKDGCKRLPFEKLPTNVQTAIASINF